ncbi:hypothetical protein [Serratia rhizosphaerae]|uniref:Uncharacterized protein n=1 Tax=Serratia rhizosphaerae TaxID=2597702 RepID=A0ABX6GTE7_9GAMM|nr:hypothetical protein [Serratia rhizosphaerae]QHA89564.1 hypothetical protein FO014_22675 [Serratia rhizosphaerae]
MSTSDESRQQLKLLRVIGFGGLVTVITAAVAIAQYQEKNQLNIEYLKTQMTDIQHKLDALPEMGERIARLEEKTDAH